MANAKSTRAETNVSTPQHSQDAATNGVQSSARGGVSRARHSRRFLFLLALAAQAAPLDWQPVAGGRMAPLTIPASGKTGFSAMPAQETGLHFTNTLDVRLIMENNNFMQGAGVALATSTAMAGATFIFAPSTAPTPFIANLGNWKFEDVTARAGVGCPRWHSTGATFADIDGDGRLDLIINTLGKAPILS